MKVKPTVILCSYKNKNGKSMSKEIQGNPLDDHLANCAAFVANLVATPWPCQGEETLKKPRSRTLSTEGKAEKKVGGQKT